MSNKPGLTTSEQTRIRDLHAQGESCNAIARDLGRSASTISKFAARHDLSWGNERTAAATEAKQANNRDKRAALESRFLDEAALLLDQLHQQHLAFNFGGKDNTYNEEIQAEPDIAGKRALVLAAGTAVDKALRLADADRASAGAVAGKSMVGSLFAALALRPPDDEPAQ